MNHITARLLAAATLFPLAACTHTAGLQEEIGRIEGRLNGVEKDIAAGTADIGRPGKDIRARFAYRPMQAWATSFGTKTATFRQTSRGGDLARQNETCKVVIFPPRTEKDPGYRVWIHEDDSTKIDLTVGPLAFVPTDEGLRFSSGFDVWAKTQIAGSGRAPCVGGWSPTVTVGAEGRSHPTTMLELKLAQPTDFTLRYDLAVISPNTIDVEFRTGIKVPIFGDVDIRRTFAIKHFARQLTGGSLNLLIRREGQILLPSGDTHPYELAIRAPMVRTDRAGISLETDVDLQR